MAVLRLAGVSFPNPDGTPRKKILGHIYDRFFTEGRGDQVELELRPEPENLADPNAVAVYAAVPDLIGWHQVGYVESEVAPKVLRALELDLVGRVRFADMNAGSRGGISAKIGLGKKKATP